jgi:SAM-dependent methyltransferase
MKTVSGIGLNEVQAVYSGAEGRLWELIMGEQIHIGGLASSMDLAETAGIGAGMQGVDLCCCTGAGMRFLVRFRDAARMTGVDATESIVSLGRQRCAQEKLDDKIEFVLADVCDSHLPDAFADFVWGEDAWCYVEDKDRLIAEAARIVKPGGVIAFTDWVEGRAMSDAEADRFLRFMKFPSLMNQDDYPRLLEANGCAIEAARDTGRYHPCIDLYLSMLGLQLTYDALKIIGFDQAMMAGLGEEMMFARELAAQGKLMQGLFVARRKE